MERTLGSDLFFDFTPSTRKTRRSLSLIGNLQLWQRRIASRHQLARLDSRLLADAGISEAQRHNELSKPFWR